MMKIILRVKWYKRKD